MNLAPFIDHTVLKNTTTVGDIGKLCSEAITHNFATVCVPPYFVQDAKKIVGGTPVNVTTVIGFPFGYHHYKAKFKEAQLAIEDGADELDMVMNLAAFKSNDVAYLEAEIGTVSRLCSENKKILKIIIESGVLTDEEIIKCCELYRHFPVQFLKTSTGYAEKSASIEAVQLMRKNLPAHIQIKASGGIKTYAFAKALVDAGATRLGCSASVAVINGETTDASY